MVDALPGASRRALRALVGMTGRLPETAELRVPGSVVFQELPAETVALDLDTGRYYALPAGAARVVELVCASGGVAAAVRRLAAESGHPMRDVESDVSSLCDSLIELGLLELAY